MARNSLTGDTVLAIGLDGAIAMVNVIPVTNNPPVINDQNLNAVTNQNLMLTLGPLTDADGEAIAYTVTGTGAANYTPTAANAGTFNSSIVGSEVLNVSADDGSGGTDTATITLTVSAVVVNNPPVVNDQSFSVDEGVNQVITLGPLTDADGDTITYTVTGTGAANFTFTAANAGTFNSSTVGSETLNVSASDGTDTDTATVTITVAALATFTLLDQNLTVEAAQNLTITLGPLVDSNGDVIVYNVSGSSDYVNGSASNQIVFNSVNVGNVSLGIQGSAGSSTVYVTSVITLDVTPAANVPVVLQNQSLAALKGVDLAITLGPLTDTDGDIITYTVTGSSFISAGSAGNQILYNASVSGTETLNVTGSDGQLDATSVITVITSAVVQIAPAKMLNIGWSIMADVTEVIPPIFQSDGLALDITRFIPNAYMDSLGDADALAAVDAATDAPAVIISAHSGGSMDDPAGPPSWYSAMNTLVTKIKAEGKEVVWFQSWVTKLASDANQLNVIANFDNMKAQHGGVVIKSMEAKRHFLERYPEYGDKVNLTGYNPPILKLNSDNTHGTYALNYMAALCIFRAMTGLSASLSTYPVPAIHEMTPEFVQRIQNTVDAVQDDYYPNVAGVSTVNAPVVKDQIVGAASGQNVSIVLGDLTTESGEVITYEAVSSLGVNNFLITDNVLNFNSTTVGKEIISVTATTATPTQTIAVIEMTVSAVGALREFYLDFGRESYSSLPNGASQPWDKYTTDDHRVLSGVLGMAGATGTLTGLIDVNGEVTSNTVVSSKQNKGKSGYEPLNTFDVLIDPAMADKQLYWTEASNGLALEFSGPDFPVGSVWTVRVSGSRGGTGTWVAAVDVNGVTGTYDPQENSTSFAEVSATVDAGGKLLLDVSGSYSYVAGSILTRTS